MKELKGTKTEQNLWTAFAGESKAFNKYLMYAKKGTQGRLRTDSRTL